MVNRNKGVAGTTAKLVADTAVSTKTFIPLAKRLVKGSEVQRREYRKRLKGVCSHAAAIAHHLLEDLSTESDTKVEEYRAQLHDRQVYESMRPIGAKSASTSDRLVDMLEREIPSAKSADRPGRVASVAAAEVVRLSYLLFAIGDLDFRARLSALQQIRGQLVECEPLLTALCSEACRKTYLGLPLGLPTGMVFRR